MQKLVKTSHIQARYSKFPIDKGRYMIFIDCWDISIVNIIIMRVLGSMTNNIAHDKEKEF